jgi:predicted Zn-dependent protease
MPPPTSSTLSSQRVRAEIVKLACLIAITVAAFLAIRSLALRAAAANLEDAAEWHARGTRALGAGDVDGAIEALRRALAKDRDNRVYGLALADALSMGGEPLQAERGLLLLRETATEDPAINVRLARLAAARDDVDTAVRYYQSSLYAPPAAGDNRRALRLELAEFLLRRGRSEQALSELIALATEVGGDLAARARVATLMLEAGDAPRALEEFQGILRADASNREAAIGAGTASFQVGDYAAAVRHLRAVADEPDLAELRATAELVLSRDPLAARLRASERRRRLSANVAHVQMRLEACAAQPSGSREPDLAAPASALRAIEARLRRPAADADLVDEGAAAIDEAQRLVASRCGALEPIDRALGIIAERHGRGDG